MNSTNILFDKSSIASMKKIACIIALTLVVLLRTQANGLPKIKYLASNSNITQTTNWAIECDEDGVFYLGNNNGLFYYSGDDWVSIPLPTMTSNIRSLKAIKNKIFIGLNGEFGYVEKDDHGTYIYKSLSEMTTMNDEKFSYIWRIKSKADMVYFQAFEAIFVLKDNTLTTIKPNTVFHNLFVVNNQIVVKQFNKGLYELNQNTLSPIEDGEIFADKDIFSMQSIDRNSSLIFTSRDGIFIREKNKIKPWNTSSNNIFKNNPITSSLKTINKTIIVGTATNGIYELNSNGDILLHINKTNGLKSNSIIDLKEDIQNNLIIATENGVELIELNSSYKYYDQRLGLDAKAFDVKQFQDRYYVATNLGVFYSDKISEAENKEISFKQIENIKEQTWKLSIIENNLYALTHTGTFKVANFELQSLPNKSTEGTWEFVKSKWRQNIIFQGTYSSLNIYKDSNNKIEFVKKIEGDFPSGRYILEDKEGAIWIANSNESLHRLLLDADFNLVKTDKFFTPEANKLTGLSALFELQNTIAVVVNGLIYNLNPTTNKFEANTDVNKALENYQPIVTIIKLDKEQYYFTGGLFGDENGGIITFEKSIISVKPFEKNNLAGKLTSSFESILKTDEDKYLITTNDGLIIVNNDDPQRTPTYKTLIKSVNVKTENNRSDNYHNITEIQDQIGEIPYKYNTINFNYFSTNYYKSNTYSTFLEGEEKTWSEFAKAQNVEYRNLWEGEYTFWVKAKDSSGEIGDVAFYKFVIKPPIYRTTAAYLVYLIILILLITWFVKRYRQFITNKVYSTNNDLIKESIHERDKLLEEKSHIEKEVITIKNSKLQSELEERNKEITTSTAHVMQLNEALSEIQEQVRLIVKDPEKSKVKLTNLLQHITQKVNNSGGEWEKFEFHFNQVHNGYLQRLKEQYPDLTTRELRLCAYLRMNLSSKEIAPLLGINYRSVEALRYRTRKKLNLKISQSLTEFIVTF